MTVSEFPIYGIGERRPPFTTVSAMLDHATATTPDRVAVRHLETVLTFQQEGRAIAALAGRLAALTGPGDVVALVMPNGIPFRLGYFATLKAVAEPALLNPLYPPAQLEPLLRAAAPKAVLCVPATRDKVAALARTLDIPHVICLGEDPTIAALVATTQPLPLPRPPEAGDVAALMFSGGTTGQPKPIAHPHERIANAMRCMEYCWPTRLWTEVWLPVAPFTHVYGFLQGFLGPVFAGAETVIPERFQPDLILDLMVRHRVTVFGGGPPAIYAGLLSAEKLAAADLSALRVCPAGGAPFPLELHQRWQRATGVPIHEGYGMTEMAPISGITALSGLRPGSVGRAPPGVDIQVVDVETGTRVLPAGERGEIRVRGPHMMSGYRGRPEATAQAIREGFIYTGDIGHLDADGFLFVTDRAKDVVFVKGFNVFPREIEEVIYTHPAVAIAGVVGAADPRTGGERLIAFVVPRRDASLSEAEIAAWCADRLVAYQRPAEFRLVDELPMTGVQKLDRVALRRIV